MVQSLLADKALSSLVPARVSNDLEKKSVGYPREKLPRMQMGVTGQ